ncbi:AI-2E family transporter [Auritidibacter ignavus]|nr:AI-2E family transporter [Auritidibacter ignavus]
MLGRLKSGVRSVRDRLPSRPPRPRFTVDDPPATSQPESGSTPTETETETEALPTYSARPIQTGFMVTIGVGIALALYWVLSNNWQLVVWILAALFITLGLDPVVRKIVHWGAPRSVGVLIAVVLLLAVFALLMWILIPTVVTQTADFIQQIPQLVTDFLESDIFQRLDDQFDLRSTAFTELNRFVSNTDNVTRLAGGLFGVGTAIINTGFSVLIVIVLTLYFLVSLPSIKFWAHRLVPYSRRRRTEELSEKITRSVGNYVIGQTVVATLNGIVAFTAVSIAGLPFSALLATFAGFMAFIPLVGAVIGGTVITLLALLTGWQSALIFAIIYFIYLQVEAYLVSPRVMRRAVSIPSSVAVIAVIAGGSLLGVLGALMAIPIAAAIMTLIKEVLIPRQDAH